MYHSQISTQLIDLSKEINKKLEEFGIYEIKSFVPIKNSIYCNYIGFSGYTDSSLDLCKKFSDYLIQENSLNHEEEINRKINNFFLSNDKSYELLINEQKKDELVNKIKEIHEYLKKIKSEKKEKHPAFS